MALHFLCKGNLGHVTNTLKLFFFFKSRAHTIGKEESGNAEGSKL